MTNKPIFIAEVKTQSPYGFKSNRTWSELFDMAEEHGDWVSIHTSPVWGGSFDYLYLASNKTMKPILAKGLHLSIDEIKKAFDYGADYVLCVGDMRNTAFWYDTDQLRGYPINKILVEPLNNSIFEHNVKFASSEQKFVWNQRDLFTGDPKIKKFETIRNEFPNIWLCQASLIKTKDDINPKADAFIVGEKLPFFLSTDAA